MIDGYLRAKLHGPLDRGARVLDVEPITPDRLTAAGLVLGLGSAFAAGLQWWLLALVLWLISRLADGLDGALARRRAGASSPTAGAGGFFDITADFTVYGATVVGVAIGAAAGYGAPWWPFLLVLLAYYINGTAFLAFSSIAERKGRRIDDGRSLSFLGGLAEGAETVAVHSLWLLLPGVSWQIAVVWAAVVAVSSVHRIVAGYRALS
ncbi:MULTISPECIES: CDP-alcohol phosphatidyltransferase family protein [Nocardiaceae]|jgi:phosphatidylglycerophosphate synthase|uniref:CDP-alcohol phosphatidyltransferase family protein n=1 Tax=Nocardiaceae TaxID=85025 RepID=UPI001E55FCD6|nr:MULTISPECIES: CDP-alcohol phosphatidyltransferase family protein [Rhodococcus]MCC8928014.1 CDP-alcohol phosphatidyltransferase family protein [Rhodococcus sp. I2R]MCZ4275719.1 CDP-alcohol phosphatidyltransferase family protein [Rhodococcus yunnanensis]